MTGWLRDAHRLQVQLADELQRKQGPAEILKNYSATLNTLSVALDSRDVEKAATAQAKVVEAAMTLALEE